MPYLKTALYALGIIAGLMGLNAYLVSEAELDEFEVQTVQTMKEFRQEIKKDSEQSRDMGRLERLGDDYYRTKMLLKQYPNDPDLLEEKQRLEAERKALREKLDL